MSDPSLIEFLVTLRDGEFTDEIKMRAARALLCRDIESAHYCETPFYAGFKDVDGRPAPVYRPQPSSDSCSDSSSTSG